MAENYRGPVAFGFDPPDAFWTDESAFEKFVIACFKGMDGAPEDDDFGVYSGEGFKLADHRDTAGSYGRADSVEDFVADNLDLSTCPDTSILDAYVNVDEARLVVKVLSSNADIAEIKHWEFSPYETMTFERVEALDEDDTYELIYKIDGLNRTYGELYGESKNTLFDSILNESAAYDAGKKAGKEGRKFNPYGLGDQDADDYADFEAGRQAGEAERSEGSNLRESARTRLSVELRQFVARFVYNMTACESEGKDEDVLYDEYAELAIKTANWCGLPEEVLPYLNYILSDDCLCCDMWKLINHIMKYLNSK